MFQTDQATAASSLPTPAAAGTPGYFTNGNPASGVAATILDADFMNMLMMELSNVVTGAGVALSKTTYNQVLAAIKRICQNTTVLTDTGSANAYAATNVVPLVAGATPTWVDGVVQAVKIAHANTSASTYAPDGLAAIPYRRYKHEYQHHSADTCWRPWRKREREQHFIRRSCTYYWLS